MEIYQPRFSAATGNYLFHYIWVQLCWIFSTMWPFFSWRHMGSCQYS